MARQGWPFIKESVLIHVLGGTALWFGNMSLVEVVAFVDMEWCWSTYEQAFTYNSGCQTLVTKWEEYKLVLKEYLIRSQDYSGRFNTPFSCGSHECVRTLVKQS